MSISITTRFTKFKTRTDVLETIKKYKGWVNNKLAHLLLTNAFTIISLILFFFLSSIVHLTNFDIIFPRYFVTTTTHSLWIVLTCAVKVPPIKITFFFILFFQFYCLLLQLDIRHIPLFNRNKTPNNFWKIFKWKTENGWLTLWFSVVFYL